MFDAAACFVINPDREKAHIDSLIRDNKRTALRFYIKIRASFAVSYCEKRKEVITYAISELKKTYKTGKKDFYYKFIVKVIDHLIRKGLYKPNMFLFDLLEDFIYEFKNKYLMLKLLDCLVYFTPDISYIKSLMRTLKLTYIPLNTACIFCIKFSIKDILEMHELYGLSLNITKGDLSRKVILI
jgi:hypothetical protein